MKGEVNDQVIHISIPRSLGAKLLAQANEEGRTFNGHCRYILTQSANDQVPVLSGSNFPQGELHEN
jgi:hypothetical protein